MLPHTVPALARYASTGVSFGRAHRGFWEKTPLAPPGQVWVLCDLCGWAHETRYSSLFYNLL